MTDFESIKKQAEDGIEAQKGLDAMINFDRFEVQFYVRGSSNIACIQLHSISFQRNECRPLQAALFDYLNAKIATSHSNIMKKVEELDE